MRIFVAGASGLIGVRLVPLLVAAGHVMAGMTRCPQKAKGCQAAVDAQSTRPPRYVVTAKRGSRVLELRQRSGPPAG